MKLKHVRKAALVSALTLGLWIVPHARAAQDEADEARLQANENFDHPDLKFEERLHRVFKNYNSDPVEESKWQNLLGARRSETYSIQTGDTLWDISETFFGDANYWPKLWSENDAIQNPHQILPHKVVHFLAGTQADSPAFSVKDAGKGLTEEPNAPSYVSAGDPEDDSAIDPEEPRVIGGKPTIPKPMTESAPPLSSLPQTFVTPPVVNQKLFDSTGLDTTAIKPPKISTEQPLPMYAARSLPPRVGVVQEIDIYEQVAGILHKIYVKMDHAVAVGDVFSVYAQGGKLQGFGHGYNVVECGGRIQINEVLDETDHIYYATVIENVNSVRRGGIISDQPIPRMEFDQNGPASEVEAKVIGGEFDQRRMELGFGGLVYLDKGSEAGLREGDVLGVEEDRLLRRPDSALAKTHKSIAVVKIAKVDKDVSTAVIVESIDDIRRGDSTGGRRPLRDSADMGLGSKILEVDEKGVTPR